jgi:hypothetical protein
MIICIDFDGTCTSHDFPRVGKDIGAVPVLKKLLDRGHKLILHTMRSDITNPTSEDKSLYVKSGDFLTDAIKWFNDHDIELWGINENPEQKSWTSSPKPYAELYIDDAALGCPLLENELFSTRPYANWIKIEEILIRKGVL